MLSSSEEENNPQHLQNNVMGESSAAETPNQHSSARMVQISLNKRTGDAKKSYKANKEDNASCRANLPKPRRVPNNFEERQEFSDDDPPKVRPEGYKSPYHLIKEQDRINVWWEGDNAFYPGTVKNIRGDGKRRVVYDDGQVMYHLLSREVITFIERSLEKFLATCFPQVASEHTNSDEPLQYPELSEFLCVGHKISIYWHNMKAWYEGFIVAKSENGPFSILYDDEYKEILDMKDETFRFVGESATVVHTSLMENYSEELYA